MSGETDIEQQMDMDGELNFECIHGEFNNIDNNAFLHPAILDEDGDIKMNLTNWKKVESVTSLYLRSHNELTFKAFKDSSGRIIVKGNAITGHENTINVKGEIKFVSPIEPGAAVTKFHVDFFDTNSGNKEFSIVGKLQSDKDAEEVYQKKIAEGHTAVYSGYDKHSSGHFVIRLGKVPVNCDAVVNFDYLTNLRHENPNWVRNSQGVLEPTQNHNHYRYHLSVVNKARYDSMSGIIHGFRSKLSDTAYAETLSLLRLPFNFEIEFKFSPGARNIVGFMQRVVQNAPTAWEFNRVNGSKAHWKMDTKHLAEHPQDLELTFELESVNVKNESRANIRFELSSTEPNVAYGAVTWTPTEEKQIRTDLQKYESGEVEDSDDEDDEPAQEYIFVVDRSGSMSGRDIDSAKETLKLLVTQMKEGQTFDIISFGSHWTSMFNGDEENQTPYRWNGYEEPDLSRRIKPVAYNQANLSTALRKIELMEADYGGTDIQAPMKAIYASPVKAADPVRRVYLLTDGGVGNTREVINDAKTAFQLNRIFSFAIGNGASVELTEGLAQATDGGFTTILSGDRMQNKVMQILHEVSSEPLHLQNIKFDLFEDIPGLRIYGPGHEWETLENDVDENDETKRFYRTSRDILSHRPRNDLSRIEPDTQMQFFYKFELPKDSPNSLREYFEAYKGEEGQISLDIGPHHTEAHQKSNLKVKTESVIHLKFDYKENVLAETGLPLFFGRHQILLFENTNSHDERATAISLKYGILSRSTAFVGYNEKYNQDLKTLRREVVNEPVAQPRRQRGGGSFGWGAPQKAGGSRQSPFGRPQKAGGAASSRSRQPSNSNVNGNSMQTDFGGSFSEENVDTSTMTIQDQSFHVKLLEQLEFNGIWKVDNTEIWKLLNELAQPYDKKIVKKIFGKLDDVYLTLFIMALLELKVKRYRLEWLNGFKKSKKYSIKKLGKMDQKLMFEKSVKFFNGKTPMDVEMNA